MITSRICAYLSPLSLVAGITLLATNSHAVRANTSKHTALEKAVDQEVATTFNVQKERARKGGAATNLRIAGRLLVSHHAPVPRPRPNATDVPTPRDAIDDLLLSLPPTLASPAAAPPSRVESSTIDAAMTYASDRAPSKADLNAIKEAVRLASRGNARAATDRRRQIRDPIGRKLVEWTILRSCNKTTSFARYAAFVQANPGWPGANRFRRCAESKLWFEPKQPRVVLNFFAEQKPSGTLGKLALARALIAHGKSAAARKYVRSAWHTSRFSAQVESQVLNEFGELLTRADHRVRMDMRLYANDFGAAMRAARRLGEAEIALVKARAAVSSKARNAHALLNAVPKSARSNPVYLLTRAQWLRRSGHVDEAGRLMLSAPHDRDTVLDPDEWWIERRILVRELLDRGKSHIAYRISRDAAPPSREGLRVDQPFTAGWIALRFLHDPTRAAGHFARIPQITIHPTSLARAYYWLGRTAEAAGHNREARRYYDEAGKYTAAYYGQLASARVGRRTIVVRRPPRLDGTKRAALRKVDLVRAVDLLYATDNRDLAASFVVDFDRVGDIDILTLIAETAAKHKDARAMLTIGRRALARGFALDQYAFPAFGLPKYVSIGPKAETSLVYAIAKAESAFNTSAVSGAKAKGLMQVTPAAGRTIARRLGIKFDLKRLLSDPSYNLQMGSAEIAHLVDTYDGNYILAFVGYNAGRGRVKEWIARYGDPRDPSVDAVDWVERIPFTETRIYVQRVMENLQVYRLQFKTSPHLTIEADMRGG
jgi:soluble lytic murein transglycosylase